jgi:hypothetical protein
MIYNSRTVLPYTVLRISNHRDKILPQLTLAQWQHHWNSLPEETLHLRALNQTKKIALVTALILFTVPFALLMLFFVFPFLRKTFPDVSENYHLISTVIVFAIVFLLPLNYLYKHKKIGSKYVIKMDRSRSCIEENGAPVFNNTWLEIKSIRFGINNRCEFQVHGTTEIKIAIGGIFADKASQAAIQALFASISKRLKLKPYGGNGFQTFENPAQHLVIKKT